MEFLSVEFSDCNFTIKRTHHRFFLECIPKISCLKKNILRRNSMADQQLDFFFFFAYVFQDGGRM